MSSHKINKEWPNKIIQSKPWVIQVYFRPFFPISPSSLADSISGAIISNISSSRLVCRSHCERLNKGKYSILNTLNTYDKSARFCMPILVIFTTENFWNAHSFLEQRRWTMKRTSNICYSRQCWSQWWARNGPSELSSPFNHLMQMMFAPLSGTGLLSVLIDSFQIRTLFNHLICF